MKYYIYGAGSFSECVVKTALKRGFEITSVIDKYTTKEHICNIPVVRLSQDLDRKAKLYSLNKRWLWESMEFSVYTHIKLIDLTDSGSFIWNYLMDDLG